jgi:hypothetical protein
MFIAGVVRPSGNARGEDIDDSFIHLNDDEVYYKIIVGQANT